MISNYLEVLVLSIVQGISEFIPVSSSAHLIIFSNIINFSNKSLIFDVGLHLGSLIAILFYLNEGMVGGETAFPRWVNGKSFHELKVKPEIGKAVLFYDQLPDGNLDDFSQHSAKPIIQGEKWLINLWIWDPNYEK